jgi:hypothetical protein
MDLESQLQAWPGTAPGLIVAWQRDGGRNRLLSSVAGATDAWRLTPRGNASFDSLGTACLDGGAMLVEGPEAALLDACRRTGELTLEVRFLTERVPQSGPARIVSFSTDGLRRNWTLAQEGEQLLFRLRTPTTGENGMNPQTTLFSAAPRQPLYLVLSYRDGEMTVYRDGRREDVRSDVRGDFRNWEPQHLLLGNEHSEPRPWLGRIERFAVHSRAMDEREIRRRDVLVRGAAQPPRE